MADIKSLLKELYILAIDTPEVERLQLQYNPTTISYNRSAQITNVGIVGRNDQLHHYVTGETTVSFDLDFYSLEKARTDVKTKIKWLESLAYSGGDRPPSRVKLVLGELFRDEIWILRSVNVTYSVFEAATKWLPLYATASLSFVRDTEDDLTSDDIRTQSF